MFIILDGSIFRNLIVVMKLSRNDLSVYKCNIANGAALICFEHRKTTQATSATLVFTKPAKILEMFQ